jgi:ABC-type multidrug transport system fused ATPase/permease subunit
VLRFPLPDPGQPDLRSAGRYLAWIAKGQRRTIAAGAFWGVLWMGTQALSPLALGRALDEGVRAHDRAALLAWVGALLGLGLVGATAGVLRHRCAVAPWITATMRTQQVVLRHAVRLGGSLPARVPAGEAANVSATDAPNVGRCFDITARGSGALVSFVMVAALLLTTSLELGLLVLVGMPLLVLGLGPLLRPLHDRQAAQRAALSEASNLAADTVSGLRVLRGIGGEAELLARYRAASQRVRAAGVETARVEATLDALQVLLPGVFVVTLTVLGARLAVRGDISPGELLAFYGYAAFLVTPLRTATEALDKVTAAFVSADRVVALLRLAPLRTEPHAPEPPTDGDLHDPTTGVLARKGLLTAVVSTDLGPLADRLGGYVDSDVTVGGTPLRHLSLADLRRTVLVVDPTSALLRGPVREALGTLDPADALAAACALDVLDSIDGGLDGELEERARELSGGQRQRLVLARALAADPPVLVLVEPTSAVDAHTESRIAHRLRAARAGRTTVLLTTSPLLLEQVDEVVLVVDGVATATGTHTELLADPAYRRVVSRDLEEAAR